MKNDRDHEAKAEDFRRWACNTVTALPPVWPAGLFNLLHGAECAQPSLTQVCDAVRKEVRAKHELAERELRVAGYYAWDAFREAY